MSDSETSNDGVGSEEDFSEENDDPGEEAGDESGEDETKDEEEGEGEEKKSIGSGGFKTEGAGTKKKKIPKETPLTMDHIKDGISMLCKTGDGLDLAYVKLVARDLELTNVFLLSTYIHLRYVDLSNNKLTSLYPLQNMRFLVSLKVANNHLSSTQMTNFPFLQYLDLSGNQIKTTQDIRQQALEKLVLAKNRLENLNGMDSANLPCLMHLNIVGNAVKKLNGLDLPSLKKLYAGKNKLNSLVGIHRMKSLVVMHIRENRIRSLDDIEDDLEKLEYLNVRANLVESPGQLFKLKKMPALKALVIAENPLSDESASYRIDVLVYARRLERIDKDPVEEEEREEAAELYPQREEERLLAERDARDHPPADSEDEEEGEPDEKGEEAATEDEEEEDND